MDCRAALASITEDANRGLMFDSDKSRIDRVRPYARIIIGVMAACIIVALYLAMKGCFKL